MPYIIPGRRGHPEPNTTCNIGELTFELYRSCMWALPDTPRYMDYNALLGALEATKLELYRRHIAPYEDLQLARNGDVY